MLKFLKNNTLRISRGLGLFAVAAHSRWRRQRLLILCYHGLSLRDEHVWRNLFVTPAFFRRRLEILARRRYRVLPLADGLRMLREGSLPPKSAAITFDDGFHDFHQHGFPLLREFGFSATVYQTTYYSDYPFPVFNLVLSYVFWRGARGVLDGAYGVPGTFDLSDEAGRSRAVDAFLEFASREGYTPAQKDELAARVAGGLGVDYAEILRLRMLQLMTGREIAEISAGGMDVQLHTHRHRTPLDEKSFVREIRDNRQWLAARTGTQPKHFCYPSGQYREEFLPWLRAEGVESATTCDIGLATRACEPLLLPRLLDSMQVTEVDFEGWLAGVSAILPHRKA
ncbi:MAG TPA: polysaccharide deacetylase family protein [Bryobacteraceae bacterium]|nr:polysaccharide deacetylase family protein [Bryobacteraceae bacterium]